MARKPGQLSPEQAQAERLLADLQNPASYFCSNPDCTQYVLRSKLTNPDEAAFYRIDALGRRESVVYTSHQFVGPTGELQRACDVCRSAIELVTGPMPESQVDQD